MLKKIICCVIIAMVLSLSACSRADRELPVINNGVLDIREGRLPQHELLALNGAWEFYWEKFLMSNDMTDQEPDMLAKVPCAWNHYRMDGKKLPATGYATYRLHVLTDLPDNTILGLQLPTFSSAYRLYINQREIAGCGVAASNKTDEVGDYTPQVTYFAVPSKAFDIVVQVSNYECAYGGFWNGITLGTSESIQLHSNIITAKICFTFGILLLISIYFLALYFANKDLKHLLYFACMSILIIFFLDSNDQLILYHLFGDVSLPWVFYLWFSSANWCIFFLLLLCHQMSASKFSKLCLKIFFVIYILFQLLFTFTKSVVYTNSSDIGNILGVAGIICAALVMLLGVKKGNKKAWVYIVCVGTLLLAFIHDIMLGYNLIYNPLGKMSYFAILICAFLLMQVLLDINKEYYKRIEASELAFLQAQIKPHFIFNTINTLIATSYENVDRTRSLMRKFAIYLRDSFDFKSTSQFVALEQELEYVQAFVEIQKARFEDKILIDYEIDQDIHGEVPILILQPIIENAIIHGVLPKEEGGHIRVLVKEKPHQLEFTVIDNGAGFDLGEWRKNTESKNYGVGLLNIDTRLKKLTKKGLTIKSEKGIGTEISWSIPIRK